MQKNSWTLTSRKLVVILTLIALTVASLIVTYVISDVSFNLAENIYPSWQQIDPDNSFLFISLHHVFQALISFGGILILARLLRITLPDFGFNTNQWRYALKRVLLFCGFWFLLQGGIVALMILSGTKPVPFSFPLTAGNFAGYFLFEILLSGTSEEILFRALVIIPLIHFGERSGYGKKASVVIAVLIATLAFMLGHIGFAFNPFRITYFNLLQQVTVVIFGLFYAWLLIKTKSLVGPILAHNFLNGVIVMISLLSILIFS